MPTSSSRIRRLASLTRYQAKELEKQNKKLLKDLKKDMENIVERALKDLRLSFWEVIPWQGGDGGQFRWKVRSRAWFQEPSPFLNLHGLRKPVNGLVHEHGYVFNSASLSSGILYLSIKKDPKAFDEWAKEQDPLLVDALQELKNYGIW